MHDSSMACRLAEPCFGFVTVPSALTAVSFSQGLQKRSSRVHRLSLCNSAGTSNAKRGGIKHQQCSFFLKRNKCVQAVAVPRAPSWAESAEYRKELAESYGFSQIGDPVPENVTLRDFAETFPKKLFEIDDGKAWKAVLKSVTAYVMGLYLTSMSPWYLLPLAWAFTGTAAAGFFAIGHECGHRSFFSNKLLEDIVGTIVYLPLIYPFEAWRYEHDRHHAKTNMLLEDTGWHPIQRTDLEASPFVRKAMIYGYGLLRPWMTIAHWLLWHFDLKHFRPNEVKRVKISLACVYAFMGVGWPLLIYYTGITGWINLWLMPWLGYHFWMSVVTMIHHTAPHIAFKPSNEWNATQAQVNGTIHCDYPSWVEFFIHDINFHIPHHISPRMPFYNLRPAQELLREKWGKYLNEATLNWRLMKTIMTTCHVYDEEQIYNPFDEVTPEESRSITFIRKYMPDWA